MSGIYKDYGYESAGDGWAQGYLLPNMLQRLDRPRGPSLDLCCVNGPIAR